MQVTIRQEWVVSSSTEDEESKVEYLVAISEAAKEDWRQPIIDYLCYGILSEDPRIRTDIIFVHLTFFTLKIHYIRDHLKEYSYDV